MKKQIFTLLTLLVLCVTGAWGESVTVTVDKYVWQNNTLYGVNTSSKELINEFTMTSTTSYGTTNPTTSSRLKVVANEELTFSAYGKTITQIVINWNANTDATLPTGQPGSISNSTKVSTWTGSATSLTIKAPTANQISSVAVTYTESDPAITSSNTTISTFAKVNYENNIAFTSSNDAPGLKLISSGNAVQADKGQSVKWVGSGTVKFKSPRPISSLAFTYYDAGSAATVVTSSPTGTYTKDDDTNYTWTAANNKVTEVTLTNGGGNKYFTSVVVTFADKVTPSFSLGSALEPKVIEMAGGDVSLASLVEVDDATFTDVTSTNTSVATIVDGNIHPVATGTATVTFNSSSNAFYNATSSNVLYIEVANHTFYTISYDANGGSGSMSDTEVEESSDQVLPANTFTKELYSFTGWVADVDVTIAGSTVTAGTLIADGATIENVTGNISLTAQWAAAYASGSYVFENNATVGTAPSKTVTTSQTEYPAFQLDNLFFSTMTIQYEAGTYSGSGDDFKGWKIKTNGATIKFQIDNDQAVTIGVGNLSSDANVSYTALDGTEKSNVALTAKTEKMFLVKGGTTFTFATAGASTVTLKKIVIEDIPTTTITTNAGKWASFTPSWNATLASGAKAYIITDVDETTVTATAVTTLKAGEGYFVKGEAASIGYTATATDVNADDVTGNLIVGQLSATTINATTPDSNTKFVLGTKSGTSGLFKVNSDVNIAAGKAYLNAQKVVSANSLSFDFDGETTGIQQVEAQKELLEGDFYNLAGQRVAQPTKGLYIINGKKVIIK